MTGTGVILLLIGAIFMVGSFFITEKLSPSELNKLAEISEDELKNIVNREVESAGVKIEDAIDEQIEASVDKVDRALEKETNEKIMAISEFSDTVVENMNKTHNEIMFLYSMLNDKHTELTGMVSDMQRLAADVRNMQENMPTQTPVAPQVVQQTATAQQTVTRQQTVTGQQTATVAQSRVQGRATAQPVASETLSQIETEPENTSAKDVQPQMESAGEEQAAQPAQAEQVDDDNHNAKILALYKEGNNVVDIAKKLGLGIGEVRLVIGLYKGESNS